MKVPFREALASLLLFIGVAHANMVGSPSGGVPTPPPQAVALGYTTLALDAEFGNPNSPPDIDCTPFSSNLGHMFYTAASGGLASQCAVSPNINALSSTRNNSQVLVWPFTDNDPGGDGSTVLQMHLTPSNGGGIGGRIGLSTCNYNGTYCYGGGNGQPINGGHGAGETYGFPKGMYVECMERVYPVGTSGLWSNCWGADANAVTIQGNGGSYCPSDGHIEFDANEFHGGYDSWLLGLATIFDWGTINCLGGSNASGISAPFPNGGTVMGYHTYGMRIQHPAGGTPLTADAWIDNRQISDGSDGHKTITVSLALNEPNQRLMLLEDLTFGCSTGCEDGFKCNLAGGFANCCFDQPISNVTDDGAGHVRLTLNGKTTCWQFNFWHTFSGITGIPSVAGTHVVKVTGPNGDLGSCRANCVVDITDAKTGQPFPFSGGYTGGGVMDPLDHARWLNHNIKWIRVWVCKHWKTTDCSRP